MSRPWFPLYPADYRGDTTHISTVQHGAYLLLIMHYWLHGGLPDDDEQLARITGLSTADWRRHRPTIQAFFGKGWRHRRIERELVIAEDRYQRRAEAGRKGGKTPKKPSNAEAMLNQPQPQPHIPTQGGKNLRSNSTDITELGTGVRPRLAVVGREDEL